MKIDERCSAGGRPLIEKKAKHLAVFVFLLFFGWGLTCESVYSPTWGYALDLPEGFVLSDREESTRYLFQHSILPVDLQVALYAKKEFADVQKAAAHIFEQLKMQHKDLPFVWRNKDAFLAMVDFVYAPSKEYKSKALSGWLLTLELPDEKGWLVMLTYTDKEKAKTCEPLMISSLDTVFTDPLSYFEPGPVTAALYPKTGEKEVSYEFNGKKIKFKIDESDALANKSVVDREFELLTAYLNKPDVIEAWKRYYKVIFRDAWSRLYSASSAVQALFSSYKKQPSAQELVKELLQFVQNFQYERDPTGSDFMNLPSALLEKKADCDSRALLMILMLKQMNVDAVLFVSPNKSHSMAGADCWAGSGVCFLHNQKKYVLAETTAHVRLGETAKEMTDQKDWFTVNFYSAADFN